MQHVLLNTLPPWAFLSLFVVLMSCISLIIFVSIKRFFPTTAHNQPNALLFSFIQLVGIGHAFLLGFVVLNLWQAYDQANKVTAEEANYLALMTLSSFALPPSMQNSIQQNIGQYIQDVIHDEWETMKKGKQSERAFNSFIKLILLTQSFTPQTEKEKIFFNQFISNMDQAYKNRRIRITALKSSLLPSLRFILIFNGILMIFLISLLENKKTKFHVFFVIIANFAFFSNIGLALLFEHPFSGNLISSDYFSTGLLARYQKP